MNVGDTVYGSFGRYGRIDVKAGTVMKLSPKGQATIDFSERWPGNGEQRLRRFSPHGWEIGPGRGEGGRLIDEASYARLAERQRAADAMRAVTNHLRSWSFKNKAELLAFTGRLNALVARVPDDESTTRDSGSGPEGGDAERSGAAECEAPQSGGEAASPTTRSETPNG